VITRTHTQCHKYTIVRVSGTMVYTTDLIWLWPAGGDGGLSCFLIRGYPALRDSCQARYDLSEGKGTFLEGRRDGWDDGDVLCQFFRDSVLSTRQNCERIALVCGWRCVLFW